MAFLQEGNWQWTSISQGELAAELIETEEEVTHQDSLVWELKPFGGLVGVLKKMQVNIGVPEGGLCNCRTRSSLAKPSVMSHEL